MHLDPSLLLSTPPSRRRLPLRSSYKKLLINSQLANLLLLLLLLPPVASTTRRRRSGNRILFGLGFCCFVVAEMCTSTYKSGISLATKTPNIYNCSIFRWTVKGNCKNRFLILSKGHRGEFYQPR